MPHGGGTFGRAHACMYDSQPDTAAIVAASIFVHSQEKQGSRSPRLTDALAEADCQVRAGTLIALEHTPHHLGHHTFHPGSRAHSKAHAYIQYGTVLTRPLVLTGLALTQDSITVYHRHCHKGLRAHYSGFQISQPLESVLYAYITMMHEYECTARYRYSRSE